MFQNHVVQLRIFIPNVNHMQIFTFPHKSPYNLLFYCQTTKKHPLGFIEHEQQAKRKLTHSLTRLAQCCLYSHSTWILQNNMSLSLCLCVNIFVMVYMVHNPRSGEIFIQSETSIVNTSGRWPAIAACLPTPIFNIFRGYLFLQTGRVYISRVPLFGQSALGKKQCWCGWTQCMCGSRSH